MTSIQVYNQFGCVKVEDKDAFINNTGIISASDDAIYIESDAPTSIVRAESYP